MLPYYSCRGERGVTTRRVLLSHAVEGRHYNRSLLRRLNFIRKEKQIENTILPVQNNLVPKNQDLRDIVDFLAADQVTA